MNKIAQQFGNSLQSFVQDEEGAQIIEYALVVAVISVAVIVAMKAAIDDALFDGWLTRVKACLSGGTCA